MPDGTRLAATLWLPEDAEADPVPAILEYLPYRKDDGTAPRDAERHPYLAATATRPCASTCAAAATPTASSKTSTCRRSSDDARRGDRVARRAAVVHGRGRDDRASRGAASTRCRSRRVRPPALGGDRQRLLDRRPLRGRRALRRRLRARAATCSPGRRRCSRTTRGRPTRRASATAGASAGSSGSSGTPAVRSSAWLAHQRRDALLAPRLGLRGLRARSRAPSTRSAAGPTATANAVLRLLGGCAGPRQGADRPVGARLPARRRARARRSASCRSALRWWDQLAQGRRDRRSWTSRAARLDAGAGRARRRARRATGALGGRAGVAAPPIDVAALALGAWRAAGRAAAEQELALEARIARGVDGGAWCADGRRAPTGPATSAPRTGARSSSTRRRSPSRTEILGVPEVVITVVPSEPAGRSSLRLCDVAPGGSSALVTLRRPQPDPPRRPRRAPRARARRAGRACASR